jgi:hypothetical protein
MLARKSQRKLRIEQERSVKGHEKKLSKVGSRRYIFYVYSEAA